MGAPSRKETGLTLDFRNATPQEFEAWLTGESGENLKGLERKYNNRWAQNTLLSKAMGSGFNQGVRNPPLKGFRGDFFENITNPRSKQNFGITKTDTGFDFSKANWASIRKYWINAENKINKIMTTGDGPLSFLTNPKFAIPAILSAGAGLALSGAGAAASAGASPGLVAGSSVRSLSATGLMGSGAGAGAVAGGGA